MSDSQRSTRKSGLLANFLGLETELKRYLLRILIRKEDIEDVLQETYIRVSKAEQSTRIESYKPFLFKVAKNLALTQIKKNNRQVIQYIEDFEAAEVIDSKSSLENNESARQELQNFYESVMQILPAQCLRVFILRKVYGFSHKEIAGKLGISVSTVEKHIITGMRKCDHYFKAKAAGTSVAPNEVQPVEHLPTATGKSS